MVLTGRTTALVALVVSFLGVALGLSVFALPMALMALALKLSAATAMGSGRSERCRDRFAVALLLEVVAVFAWGGGLLEEGPRFVVTVGLVGLCGTIVSWLAASQRVTADRRRWTIERGPPSRPHQRPRTDDHRSTHG